MVDGQRQIASLITGQGPLTPLADPLQAMTAADGQPAAAWLTTEQDMRNLLDTVDTASKVPTPQGQASIEAVLTTAVIEPLVHAWDLAQAAGVAVTLDTEAVDLCLAAIAPVAEQFAATGMFAPALPIPAGAHSQQRLLALLGRQASA
jgi:uncharacterized protein (TIGR03086 family)